MALSAEQEDFQDPASILLNFSKLRPEVRKELHGLCKLDNYHALLALLLDYLGIALAIYLCVGVSYWFYPLAIIYIGSTQRAFVNILHESTHKVLTRNSRLNLILGTFFASYFVLHLYNPYRNTHIGFHHRFLGDAKKDPDYNFHVQAGLYDHTKSNRAFFLKNIAFAVLGFRTPQYINYVIRDRILFKADDLAVSMPIKLRTERTALLLQWAALLAITAWGGWLFLLLIFWIVPLFTTAIAVGWLSELAEHYPLPESENKQILMTRNRHGWAIERFLLGRHHDNYHLVHHLNTGIPFWNLKRAHHALLSDPAYARWDGMWAGVISRSRGRRDRETLMSYASKYRAWMRAGGDLQELSGRGTFAEAAALGVYYGARGTGRAPDAS